MKIPTLRLKASKKVLYPPMNKSIQLPLTGYGYGNYDCGWDWNNNEYYQTVVSLDDKITKKVLNGISKTLGKTRVNFSNRDSDSGIAWYNTETNQITINVSEVTKLGRAKNPQFLKGLVLHEVGHSNHTSKTKGMFEQICADEKIYPSLLHNVFNVVEDFRVNNLMSKTSKPIKRAIDYLMDEGRDIIKSNKFVSNVDGLLSNRILGHYPKLQYGKDAPSSLKQMGVASEASKIVEEIVKDFDVDNEDKFYAIDKAIEYAKKLNKFYHDKPDQQTSGGTQPMQYPFKDGASSLVDNDDDGGGQGENNSPFKEMMVTCKPKHFTSTTPEIESDDYDEAKMVGELLARKLTKVIRAKKRKWMLKKNAMRLHRRSMVKQLAMYGKLIDTRIFQDMSWKGKGKKHQVIVLIDNSGSMRGDKIHKALYTGIVLHHALKRLGVKHEIRGFQAANNGYLCDTRYAKDNQDFGLDKWETSINKDGQFHSFGMTSEAGNLKSAIDSLKKQKGTNVIFVVADGYPNTHSFPQSMVEGISCQEELKRTAKEAHDLGMRTVGFAIPDANPDYMRECYNTVHKVNNVAELPDKIVEAYKTIFKRDVMGEK